MVACPAEHLCARVPERSCNIDPQDGAAIAGIAIANAKTELDFRILAHWKIHEKTERARALYSAYRFFTSGQSTFRTLVAGMGPEIDADQIVAKLTPHILRARQRVIAFLREHPDLMSSVLRSYWDSDEQEKEQRAIYL